MRLFNKALTAFFDLFFPKNCLACDKHLGDTEGGICLTCSLELPRTDFEKHPQDNDFTKRFEGRLPIEGATALYFFQKSSRVQNLIHAIKYKDRRETAQSLGTHFGNVLLEQPFFSSITAIVPVPMHPRKQILRGYNQAHIFAEGLSASLQKPIEDILEKTKMTDTQTRKSRLERAENVADVYRFKGKTSEKQVHFLVVDDVMTTGATLEACAEAIVTAMPNAKISFATIAFAH